MYNTCAVFPNIETATILERFSLPIQIALVRSKNELTWGDFWTFSMLSFLIDLSEFYKKSI